MKSQALKDFFSDKVDFDELDHAKLDNNDQLTLLYLINKKQKIILYIVNGEITFITNDDYGYIPPEKVEDSPPEDPYKEKEKVFTTEINLHGYGDVDEVRKRITNFVRQYPNAKIEQTSPTRLKITIGIQSELISFTKKFESELSYLLKGLFGFQA